MKLSLFVPSICTSFLMIQGVLLAAPETAPEAYQQIAAQLKAGEVEPALKAMTKEARQDFLSYKMEVVVEAVVFEEEIPVVVHQGVKMTPATLGLDTFAFPKWLTDEESPRPTNKEEKALKEELMGLLNKAQDPGQALRALILLSEALEPGDFNGKVMTPKEEKKPSPGRVWVEFDDEGGETEVLPVLFEKVEGQWMYAGWDWEALEEERRRFVEKKDLKISGKTVEGQVVKLSDYKDKVVLIDFWGTW